MRKIPKLKGPSEAVMVSPFVGCIFHNETEDYVRKYVLDEKNEQFSFHRATNRSKGLCGEFKSALALIHQAQRCTSGPSAVFEFASPQELEDWLKEAPETAFCALCAQTPCRCYLEP